MTIGHQTIGHKLSVYDFCDDCDSCNVCDFHENIVSRASKNTKKTVTKEIQHGFTLIELALVIAGLAIIAFGSFIAAGSVLDNARTSSTASQIETVKKSLELAKLHTGCQPDSLAFLVLNEGSYTQCGIAGSIENWSGPYIKNANIITTPGSPDLGHFKLDNITEGIMLRLVTNSATDVVLESNTVGAMGTGIVDVLCPTNSATPVGGEDDLTISRKCGFKHVSGTDKNQQFFWIGQ